MADLGVADLAVAEVIMVEADSVGVVAVEVVAAGVVEALELRMAHLLVNMVQDSVAARKTHNEMNSCKLSPDSTAWEQW